MNLKKSTWLFLLLVLGIINENFANQTTNENITSDTLYLDGSIYRTGLDLETSFQEITICNFIPNENYDLFLSKDELSDCSVNVSTEGISNQHGTSLSFAITQSCQKFQLTNDCAEAVWLGLSIGCNSCKDENAAMKSMTVIATDNSYNPEALIKDVFIGGNCFNVDEQSIVYDGHSTSRGYFNGGETSINIEEGIILSTGNIDNAIGPNDAYNAGNGTSLLGYDDDLNSLLSNPNASMYDLAALEFDFTPTSDMISFDFVFASEEYCEYAGSSYNDVFGFFISGPGFNGQFTNGAENIALVPNSTNNVAINSINHNTNATYYVGNVTEGQLNSQPLSCSNYPFPAVAAAPDDIQFDGFTTVFTASATVTPCETYHIKLIIADVNDAYFDSAVFLKANSFMAGGSANVISETSGVDSNIALENCGDAFFTFERFDSIGIDEDLIINYTIGGGSATQGIDFGALPTYITIPAGQMSYSLPVDIFEDNIVEGQENIILELDAPCSCDVPYTEMIISDLSSFTATLDDIGLCGGGAFTLSPVIDGGMPGYTYQWSTGDIGPQLFEVTQTTNDYAVTVTDACGNTEVASANVEIVDLPTASMNGSALVCPENNSVPIEVTLDGTGPWNLTYKVNNGQALTADDIQTSPFVLDGNVIGTYELVTVSNAACDGFANGDFEIAAVDFDFQSTVVNSSCPDSDDGSIEITIDGGTGPYSYQWDNNIGAIEDPTDLAEGNYAVIISDANGCTTSNTFEIVLDASAPIADAGNEQAISCTSPNTNLLAGSQTSFGDLYVHWWTTADGSIIGDPTSLSPEINAGGQYEFFVQQVNSGCIASDTVIVTADTLAPIPDIIAIGPLEITCTNPGSILNATGSTGIGDLTFDWSTTDGNIDGNENTPLVNITAGGTYTVTITDLANGCSSTEEMIINENVTLPQVVIMSPPTLTCTDSLVSLDGSNSSVSSTDFQIIWEGPGLVSETNSLTPAVNIAGQYVLTLINLENGCDNFASIEVTADLQAPLSDAGDIIELDCNTNQIQLDGGSSSEGSGYVYSWTTPEGHILEGAGTMSPLVDATGTYYLEVLDLSNGCTDIDDVIVVENTNVPREAVINPEAPICYGDFGSVTISAVIGGEMPFVYSYDEGETFVLDTALYALSPGWHNILIQDAIGCEYEQAYFIPDVLPLEIYVEPELTIQLGETAQLDAVVNIPPSRISEIIWNPSETLSCADCLDPIANPLNTTRYTIQVFDDKGCETSEDILLKVDKDRGVFIPNAFSPNGDGNNDVFFINSDVFSVKEVRDFKIFNRWGEQIYEAKNFQTNDPLQGWDGTLKGEQLNPSVFVYYAVIEFVDGSIESYEGDISIIR